MNYYPFPEEVAEIPLDNYTGILALSGGVESVALLSWLKTTNEKFVAFNLVVSQKKPPYGPIEDWMLKQRGVCRKITSKLDVPLIEVDMKMTNLNTVTKDAPMEGYVHQHWYFAWYFNLFAMHNPSVNHFYYGVNSTDCSANMQHPHRVGIENVSKAMTGVTRLSTPLVHLSKAEQWELIPDDIKPLVITCFSGVCGDCAKCQERKNAGIPLK